MDFTQPPDKLTISRKLIPENDASAVEERRTKITLIIPAGDVPTVISGSVQIVVCFKVQDGMNISTDFNVFQTRL